MSNRNYNGFKKIGTAKWVIITAVLFAFLYFLINGNIIGAAKLDSITDGAGILDMKMGYTADEAYDLFDAQGEEGRAFYLTRIFPLDLVFPAAYTIFYIALLAFIIKRLFPDRDKLLIISLFPIIGGLLDYTENILIVTMISNYPERLDNLAETASVVTQAKFAMVYVNVGILVVGLFAVAVRCLIGRSAKD